MGIVETLLTVAVPVLIGAGMTLASMNLAHKWEPLAARVCFVVAGFLVIGLVFRWLADADWPPLQKIFVGIAMALPTLAATLWGVRWVGFRATALVRTGVGEHSVTSHHQAGGTTAHIVLELEMSQDHRPNVNVTSYNQSGGVTAHTVHVGRMPRSIDDRLRNQILRELPRDKPITVVAVMGDSEACLLAEQIHAFLKENGFSLQEPGGISQAVYMPTPKGLTVSVKEGGLDFIVGANA